MNPKKYQSEEFYEFASESLYAVSGMVLFSFAKNECDLKNTILRNFIARSAMSLKSIFSLWKLDDYQNAWVVHRALVDRMFHLHHIGENDEFSDFDDWSFFEQYKLQNRVKSDSEFKHEAVGWAYELNDEQKARIKNLSKNKPTWQRPKAEDVAKGMGMKFLYKYGYDYASMHVHPMANDGQEDFHTITKIEPSINFPSNIAVLSNTILTSSMILQNSLNYSSFRWRKILWDCIDEIRESLDTGDTRYQITCLELSKIFTTGNLCEAITV